MAITLIKPCDKNTTFSYYLNAIITARLETGLRSDSFGIDEDVNVYLAGMLQRFAVGNYVSKAGSKKVLTESELIAAQENKKDIRERYLLYKENAEEILFNITIMGGVEKKMHGTRAWMSLGEDVYMSRCRAYFSAAASYGRQTPKKEYGMAKIFDKMVENFTIYLNLLYHVKEHYFRFDEKFTEGEWFHFVYKNVIHKPGLDSKVYVELMDKFLETLSLWKKSNGSGERDMLRIMASELKRLNPEFNYDIESLFNSARHVLAA